MAAKHSGRAGDCRERIMNERTRWYWNGTIDNKNILDLLRVCRDPAPLEDSWASYVCKTWWALRVWTSSWLVASKVVPVRSLDPRISHTFSIWIHSVVTYACESEYSQNAPFGTSFYVHANILPEV